MNCQTNLRINHLTAVKSVAILENAIAHGLPQIDTSKTAVKEICPTFLQPVKCEISRYRTLSGMCNNLDNPSWGSARSAMIRFIPPSYGDGISIPRRAFDGSPLPSPRVVSLVMHHDVSEHDFGICNMIAAWGQMLDHDLTRAAPSLAFQYACAPLVELSRPPTGRPASLPYTAGLQWDWARTRDKASHDPIPTLLGYRGLRLIALVQHYNKASQLKDCLR
ncbi:peroxidase [Trichonephila clavipes]|nr:peroxidase [Trichonephila clavipes]